MKETIKRVFCAAFALVMLFGAVPRVQALGSFSDISDQTTAINAEILQMMGVVNGTGGSQFNPNSSLTRAQFCKMAVEVMQQGDRVLVHKNYTIFPDVKPSHWASGYVNLASSIEIGGGSTGGTDGSTAAPTTRLISGVGDGTFRPDATITYGQAVTILMRMLGYGDMDVGAVWPDGYLDAAMLAGLTKNVKASGSSAVTRGQAAQLFVNLLSCEKKSGGKYYEDIATPKENVVLLDANAKDAAGLPMMKTSEGDFYLAGNPGSGILSGYKGTLLVSKDNAQEAITFLPAGSGISREITIAKAEANSITDQNGKVYTMDANAQLYQDNSSKPYAENFAFLRAGTMVTIYLNDRNRVDTVFVGATTSEDAVVVEKDGSTDGFSLLTDRTDYRIVKHGEEITSRNIRAYDVATYSASNNTIYLSDSRITVYYENVYPSPTTPNYIKAVGITGSATGDKVSGYMEVMPSAYSSLSKCSVGTTITLLLTENNKVAAAYPASTVSASALGYVNENGTLEMFNGLKIDSSAVQSLEGLNGKLVLVKGVGKKYLSVTAYNATAALGDFTVAERKVGTTPLAADARIFVKSSGALKEITLADIKIDVVKRDHVVYAGTNYAGKVDILILNNLSNDSMEYGRVYLEGAFGEGSDFVVDKTHIRYGDNGTQKTVATFKGYNGVTTGQWIGFTVPDSNSERIGEVEILTAVKGVTVSDWKNENSVYVNGTLYTAGSTLNNGCYNLQNNTWFESLNRALAYGGTMTLFVDSNNIIRGIEINK